MKLPETPNKIKAREDIGIQVESEEIIETE
jgi:hypothetical protein